MFRCCCGALDFRLWTFLSAIKLSLSLQAVDHCTTQKMSSEDWKLVGDAEFGSSSESESGGEGDAASEARESETAQQAHSGDDEGGAAGCKLPAEEGVCTRCGERCVPQAHLMQPAHTHTHSVSTVHTLWVCVTHSIQRESGWVCLHVTQGESTKPTRVVKTSNLHTRTPCTRTQCHTAQTRTGSPLKHTRAHS